MNKIKYALIALMTLAGGLSALAADTATQVLDKVVATIQKAPSLTMNMTVLTGSATESAHITVAKEKFTFGSGDLSVFYDGTTQWTYDKGVEEVSLTTPTADELMETNPLAFISAYKNNYNVSMAQAPGTGSYAVRMEARRKSAYVRNAVVTIDKSTNLPTAVTALLSTGQKLNIRIVSATVGKALPVSAFRFDTRKYPGAEVLDLR